MLNKAMLMRINTNRNTETLAQGNEETQATTYEAGFLGAVRHEQMAYP
jgi:hypothetical protein